MKILRVRPYEMQATIKVSDANTEYEVSVEDMADHSVESYSLTSDSNSNILVDLPSRYDNTYLIYVNGQEIFVEVVRPYVDPKTMAKTASDISEYEDHEELARAIIDSVVPEGFYYKKELMETVGLGADYLPVWKKAQKLLKIYENNIKVFDSEEPTESEVTYGLSDDRTAITFFYSQGINRSEGAPLIIPSNQSDMIDLVFGYRGFPKTFDYTIILETGYQEVPSDIVKATKMLVDDISCGRLDYYRRYISDYNTDQFKIKFDKGVFEGTGNILVDKILSKYAKSIRKVGVL
jgi:hypothetical protein